MTRLNYDDTDREIREALSNAMKEYKETSDKRRCDIINDRAVTLATNNKVLRKMRTKKHIMKNI